jgi:divalent metal cation (Fe/Co/Zn/Cd) transporter
MAGPAETALPRAALVLRGQRLEYFTIGYNSLEAVVAVVLGLWAGSIALVGFGLDSVIEVSSGAILLWRLRADRDEARREHYEQLALRGVGASLLALSAYVAWEAAASLAGRQAPEESLPGIALAVVSLIVMPVLARAKRRVARSISSAALTADARQTDFCVYLSAILLGGLSLHTLFGWWWADPIAGLLMVPIIGREGIQALRGQTCCDAGCRPH